MGVMANSAELSFPRRRPLPLEKRRHTDYGSGILFYDDELDVPGSKAHNRTGHRLGTLLCMLAERMDLELLSDNPIWYIDPRTGKQKAFYGDLVFARTSDAESVTANELLLAIEILSTNDSRREKKDTVFQRELNEHNSVPEFGLLFPELDDER